MRCCLLEYQETECGMCKVQNMQDPNTPWKNKQKINLCLTFEQNEDRKDNIQMVLRIHTSIDKKGFKNSIISCWKISNKRLQNYLRNKKILYKQE